MFNNQSINLSRDRRAVLPSYNFTPRFNLFRLHFATESTALLIVKRFVHAFISYKWKHTSK